MKSDAKKGYSLIELMVALGVFGILMTMVMLFYIDSQRLGFRSEFRNQVNRDFRTFTQQMARDAHNANFFLVYEDFERASAKSMRLDEMRSGDYVIFASLYDISEDHTVQPHARGSDTVRKIVGYYRDVQNGDLAPVFRYEINLPPGSKAVEIEKYLPTDRQSLQLTEVVDTSEGLSDGALFYNFRGRSVLINGRFYRGRDNQPVTETYNFTISPRG